MDYFTSSCRHLQSLSENHLVIPGCRFLTTVAAPISITQPRLSSPSFIFRLSPGLKPKSETGGPHHTSSTPGLLPPPPSSSGAVGEGACWFCVLGWRGALISSFPLTCHPLKSILAQPFHQSSTVGTRIHHQRQLIDFSVKWDSAGGAWLPEADGSGLMPADIILQH